MFRIADNSGQDTFRNLKTRKYYVFPSHFVFRQKDGVYAMPHRRTQEENAVDVFEREFGHLGLSWDAITELKLDEIQTIIARIKEGEDAYAEAFGKFFT